MNNEEKNYRIRVSLLLTIICGTLISLTWIISTINHNLYNFIEAYQEPVHVEHIVSEKIVYSEPIWQPQELMAHTTQPKIQDPNEQINNYIYEICKKYNNIEPEIIMSMVYHESRYNPKAVNGNCVGLMQVSTRWHADRAVNLGVTDFYDPYSNILIGVDYLSELVDKNKDITLALMLYNMKHSSAFEMYKAGQISGYAKSVLTKADEYK